MFAFVHAYYFVTYGVASAVSFIDLACFGVAMVVVIIGQAETFWLPRSSMASTTLRASWVWQRYQSSGCRTEHVYRNRGNFRSCVSS